MEETKNTEPISKKLLVLNALLVISIVFMVFLIYGLLHKPVVKEEIVYNEKTSSAAFDSLELEAKSVYVFDIVKNEVIFKKNEFVQLPLASITKLMTALTAVELVPENSRITIRKEFLSEEGDSGLLAGESWRLRDLLDFSLTVSSNDGARSLASVIGAINMNTTDYDLGRKDFISKMNEKAEELGLKQTYFINETGLDNGALSGGYGSAIDVSKLMEYLIENHSEILEATKYQEIEVDSLDKTHTAVNTNFDVDQIPGLIASKTGYTSMAGGNLVIAFDASIGRPIVVVVLGSSIEGRFTDVSKLVEASRSYVSGAK
ncbi:MAG: D-alanyl-D-alanine carboxypeptidase [Patescibacteria group bacterium]|jgi:D-alanyl-D-alanine carboxypeptidase|nr:D-alanyl-D-alanine carboxypeptidase [Patescibacteria group bacterium]